MGIFEIAYKFAVFPGFLFTSALGLLLTWLDRKVTARLQWRVGPPWYQPFADILKLFGKQVTFPEGASIGTFVISPMIGLSGIMLASSILWAVNFSKQSVFAGDLIVVIYLLTIPSLALMMGSFASGSPFAQLGGSREMKLILSYELPFIVAVFTPVAKAGSILFGTIVGYQSAHGMFISNPSCIVAFLVVLICALAKLGAVPFDVAEAEQEIASGVLVEYSGSLLAIIKIAKAMLLASLPLFMIILFMGGADLQNSWGYFYFALKYFFIVILFVLVKNVNPRLRIDQITRFFWGPVLALSVAGFLLAVMGV